MFSLPKFHCEHNPIERVWCHSKRYTHANCNYSMPGLRKTVVPGLETVDIGLIRKFFRKSRDYLEAYASGKEARKEVQQAVKEYKSHHRVIQTMFVTSPQILRTLL